MARLNGEVKEDLDSGPVDGVRTRESAEPGDAKVMRNILDGAGRATGRPPLRLWFDVSICVRVRLIRPCT
jgi:hypothetical protein